MEDLPKTYHCLLKSRNLAADDVLLNSLTSLEPAFQLDAIRILLTRRQPHALLRLVELFDRLPAAARQLILDHAAALDGAIREAIKSSDENSRINVVMLITQSRSYSTAYILSNLLRSTSARVRAKAAAALRDLTQTFVDRLRIPTPDPSNPAAVKRTYEALLKFEPPKPLLLSALLDALASYDTHFRTTALDAILLMSLDLEQALVKEISKPRSKCWTAFVEHLQNDPQAVMATFALQALGQRSTRTQVAKAISDCQDENFMSSLCYQSWLLGDMAIRSGCQQITHLAWLEPEGHPLLHLNAAQFRKAERFLAATRIDHDKRVQWYRTVLLSQRKDLHALAMAAVAGIYTPASTELLEIMIDWSEPELVEFARRELHRRRPDELAVSRTPPPASAAQTGSCAAPQPIVDFQEYWSSFDSMEQQLRRTIGRRLLASSAGLLNQLTDQLGADDATARVRAIQIIRLLGQVSQCADHLIRCCRDTNRYVRSAAVRAVGQLGDETAERILMQAINDPDRRVRANAIDALENRHSRRVTEQLKLKLHDVDHRIRAAAIQTLLRMRVREAAEALLALLADESQPHRISALWVIEKLDLYAISQRIKDIAEQDPDETVRRRARRVLRSAQRNRLRQRRAPIPEPFTRGTHDSASVTERSDD